MGAALYAVMMFGQNQEQRIKEPEKITFKPHWFIQAQIGAAHTVGEAKFTDLISPAAALNVGYKFAPAFGARVGVSGWQAKGGWVNPQQTYQYKYLQGNVDIMADLSTLFCGFNPKRVFNGYLFAGAGLNRGFDNDEANALDTRTYEMEYLWQEGKFLIAGRFGLGCDLRLNDRLSINIEANANALSDKFNSKKADNADWQLNALAGFTFKFGKSGKKAKPVVAYTPEVVETVVEVQQETKPVYVPAPVEEKKEEVKPLTENIFFNINSSVIRSSEESKIADLVAFLQKNADVKVSICGYADAGTGTTAINLRLSKERALAVEKALKAKGIAADRIMVDFKGDKVQPFSNNNENRVAICITE